MARPSRPAPKLPRPELVELLKERLEEKGEVEFKTGAKVKVERRYTVTTPLGAVVKFTETELGRAYALAERGPAPLPKRLHEDVSKWGDDPPF